MIKIRIDIFDTTVFVAHTDRDMKKLLKTVQNKYNYNEYKSLEDLKNKVNGVCIEAGRTNYVFLPTLKLSIIVHEFLHVVQDVTCFNGVNDRETEAYMLDYLVSSFLNKVEVKDV